MINASIARKDLDAEMTVVRNEFESGENSPSSVLRERVAAGAYLWHNYGRAIIGARSELRSEAHTSELQSLRHLVCRLLLEKKKTAESVDDLPVRLMDSRGERR